MVVGEVGPLPHFSGLGQCPLDHIGSHQIIPVTEQLDPWTTTAHRSYAESWYK